MAPGMFLGGIREASRRLGENSGEANLRHRGEALGGPLGGSWEPPSEMVITVTDSVVATDKSGSA